jgi:hypothetical protein
MAFKREWRTVKGRVIVPLSVKIAAFSARHAARRKAAAMLALRCITRSCRRRIFVSRHVTAVEVFSSVSLLANAARQPFIPHSADARATRALACGPEMASPAVSLFTCRVREGRQVFFWRAAFENIKSLRAKMSCARRAY